MKLILIISSIILKITSSQNLIQYNAPCRRSDPKFENCLIKAFENVKYELATGNWFPEIQIRPIDPFNLQNHVFGNGQIFQIITNNMTVLGLSNYKVENYSINARTLTADITMLFPKISDTGDYSGSINLLGVNFNGSFKSRYRNTRAFLHFEFQRIRKNGIEFLNILDVSLSSDKKFIALETGHRIHDVAIPIIYPYIERSYGKIIRDEMNKVLDLIPLESLLPE